MVKIVQSKSRATAEKKAAQVIAAALRRIVKKKGRAVLAVPGGRSVSEVFRLLSAARVDWSKVHIFMVDERLVPLGHKDSNFNLVEENLLLEFLKKRKVHLENIHPFLFRKKAADFGLGEYARELKRVGGGYDVVLLSSGEDGHVGALYPKHASVRSKAKYFLSMKDSPKPPSLRMTMSKQLLLDSDTAVVLFFGEGKRVAFEKFLDEDLGVADCPAKIVSSVKNGFVFRA